MEQRLQQQWGVPVIFREARAIKKTRHVSADGLVGRLDIRAVAQVGTSEHHKLGVAMSVSRNWQIPRHAKAGVQVGVG
jgi:hypothetical protein